MSWLGAIDWIWPALGLAFLLGIGVSRWWTTQIRSDQSSQVSQEYFKGLNFLLNEQPDKAIEVFIKALEVDSETVELHLALGGLFRRKGQVDRATRIHQNLIARPNLTEEQRLQAIYELAHDYYKAGLLDRAENLFLELRESVSYRQPAIEGLCNIYQQQKDWQKAIDVLRLHKRGERAQHAVRVSHYWCELAVLAIESGDYEEAGSCLRNALAENRGSARAILLRGEVKFKQADYRAAIDLWQSLSVSNPKLAELVVEKTIMGYQRLGDADGLKEYLLNVASIPKDPRAFDLWHQALTDIFGQIEAAERIFQQIHQEGLSGPVANYLFTKTDQENVSIEQLKVLLKDLLNRARSRKIEYTCAGCGFDTKAMHWLCPNCGEWDSFS